MIVSRYQYHRLTNIFLISKLLFRGYLYCIGLLHPSDLSSIQLALSIDPLLNFPVSTFFISTRSYSSFHIPIFLSNAQTNKARANKMTQTSSMLQSAKKTALRFPYLIVWMFSHCISTADARKITVAYTKHNNAFKAVLLNVAHKGYISVRQNNARPKDVQEFFDIFLDTDFDANIFTRSFPYRNAIRLHVALFAVGVAAIIS